MRQDEKKQGTSGRMEQEMEAAERRLAAELKRHLDEGGTNGKTTGAPDTGQAGADLQADDAKSRKKKKPTAKLSFAVAGITLAVICAVAAVSYIQIGKKYDQVYFPNTIINGINASGKTVEEVKNLISAGVEGYTLTLVGRNGEKEHITEEEIGLHTAFDGSLEQILNSQEKGQWLSRYFKEIEYQISAMAAYDESALEQLAAGLSFFKEEKIQKPENAYLSEYLSGQGYSIVPSQRGNQLDQEAVKKVIGEAAAGLLDTVSLEEAGCYIEPEITESDANLKLLMEQANQYTRLNVTYQFGEEKEILNGDTVFRWLNISDSQVTLDEAAVAAYVKELAEKHNTAGKAKTLKTSYGPVIKVPGGFYGWKINQSEETSELLRIIRLGESQTREPVYSQTAASHGDNDYGDTYVEMNLTAQHLFFYKDGKLLVESDFVSGNLAKNYGTPAGTFPLTYKQRDAVLKGEDYRTPVSYWMPFNGGIGMHDANWRSAFGGTIYKTGGSHGCINLPPSAAKTIYENISAGMPVICYNLEGTEKKTTSTGTTQAPETQASESTPVENVPTETTPAVQPSVPETTAQQPSVPETTAPAPPIAGNSGGGSIHGPGGSEAGGSSNNGPGGSGPGSSDPGGNVGPGM